MYKNSLSSTNDTTICKIKTIKKAKKTTTYVMENKASDWFQITQQ